MFNLLIVDDEKLIRHGLRDLIPWKKLGISNVHTAASGREALNILKQNPIDILLTDICMPEITGIMLIEEIRRYNQHLRILVLSGYDDFEYAQQCCKMQVHDFILKPIDEDVLMLAIEKQIDVLKEQKENKQFQKIFMRAQGIHDSLRLERCARMLNHGEIKLPKAQSILKEYDYIKDQSMQVALLILPLVENKAQPEEDDFKLLSTKNICIEMVDIPRDGITFKDGHGKIGIIFFLGNESLDVYSRLTQINTRIKDEQNSNAKIVMGSIVQGFSQLPISYNDATHSLQSSLQDIEATSIYQNEQIAQNMRNFYQAYGEIKMFICANINDEDKLIQGIENFMHLCDVHNLSLPMLRRSCFEIISSIYYAFLFESGSKSDDRLNNALCMLQGSDRKSALLITKQFVEQLYSADKQQINDIVFRAKKYIIEHLNEELSVSSVAAQLFVNANYFSRLFKKISGEGCNEYITRKRIEKAKLLLASSGLRAGDVAEMVGYRDKNYFSLTFKKYTGKSPTLYRQNIRNSAGMPADK